MMTIGSNVQTQIEIIRKKRQRPRKAVMAWMRRNPYWYREAIAQEWERQTGEDWEKIFAESVAA